MFGRMKNNGYQGPYRISGTLARLIGEEWGRLPQSNDHWVEYLAVSRPHPDDLQVVDVRIYDNWRACQEKLEIKNYSCLDGHPELVLLEGWYDEKSKKACITAKAA